MNKKKQLIDACLAYGYDRTGSESDAEFLSRVLPEIAGELRPDKRLSPLEVNFFQMADKALFLLYQDLGYEPKDIKKLFEDKPREQIARELARLSQDKEAAAAVNERMFANQTTVHQLQATHPPFPKEAQPALVAHLGRDIFKGEGPKGKIGSAYVPVSATILDGHIYCVAMAHTVVVDEHVNNRFMTEDVARLQTVYIVVDPTHKSVEFRGPVSQKAAAIKAFTNALADGGHECQTSPLAFDSSDAHELVRAIEARGRKVVIRNESGAQSGTGKKTLEGDANFFDPKTGQYDYFKSEDYKKEMAQMRQDEQVWDMGLTLDYDNRSYPIDINLASASLRFPDASTTDSVIRFVSRELTKIRRERERREGKSKSAKA